jgi:hypothetical protein
VGNDAEIVEAERGRAVDIQTEEKTHHRGHRGSQKSTSEGATVTAFVTVVFSLGTVA